MQYTHTHIKKLRRKFFAYLTVALGLGIILVWFSVQFDAAIRQSWMLLVGVCVWIFVCVYCFSLAETYRNDYDYAHKGIPIPPVNTMQHGLNKRFVQLLHTVGWILFPLGTILYYTFDVPSIGRLGILLAYIAGYALIRFGKVPPLKSSTPMRESNSNHDTIQFNTTHEYKL